MTTPPHPDTAPAVQAWWLAAVEQVVLRALELSGKRLLGALPRAQRHRSSLVRRVPVWQIHTTLDHPATGDAADRMLDGALETARVAFGDDDCVMDAVRAYCHMLLTTGTEHTRDRLATWLARRGCTPTGTP